MRRRSIHQLCRIVIETASRISSATDAIEAGADDYGERAGPP
jgi:hypothetical protein